MGQNTTVADFQLVVLVPLNTKLQKLTILSLECNVIGVTMMMVTVAMMMVRLSSLILNSSCSPLSASKGINCFARSALFTVVTAYHLISCDGSCSFR